MSGKLLWLGLTLIVALAPLLTFFNFMANTQIITALGALVMCIGAVLLLFDK